MKPIVYNLPAFDKNIGTVGTFITSEQIYQYKIIIKDINTNEIIYQKLSPPDNKLNRFEIPPFGENDNTLKNGCSYRLCIKVWKTQADVENDIDPYISDDIIIKCVSTPHFQLDIKTDDNKYTLQSTTLLVGVTYSANDNDITKEQLNEYFIVLCDSDGNKIYKSNINYDINKKIEINDLENKKTYTVTAYGKTINGMEISSTPVIVNVNYKACKDYSVLSVENDKKNACINIKSHIDGVLYKTDKPPLFKPHLNLSKNKLKYYDGINIKDNFSLFLIYKPLSLNESVLSINNGEIRLNFKTKPSIGSIYKPFFEFYTKNKMVIINNNESQNKFTEITGIDTIKNNGYKIKLARMNKKLIIKISDWSDS